jgi:hypothetical protein
MDKTAPAKQTLYFTAGSGESGRNGRWNALLWKKKGGGADNAARRRFF